MSYIISKDYLKYGAPGNPSIWKDRAMTSAAGAQYTLPIRGAFLDGAAAVLLETTAAVDIDIELSMNGVDFYAPYDTEGNLIDQVAAAVAANRWIQIGVLAAPWFRFEVTPGADSTVSLQLTTKEFA